MRVLFINQAYHPDVAATAQHIHDLARHLVRHGHQVEVIASRSIYGQAGACLPRSELVEGVQVHRVGRSLFGKAGLLARAADFALFYMAAALKSVRVRRPDVVVCLTTPPFISLLGVVLRIVRRSRYVHWLMDLYPDVAVGCGVMRRDALSTRLLRSINRFTLRQADLVVVLGRCMQRRVLELGVDAARVRHIGVWSDQTEVRPIPREANPYRREWNLDDSFVVMYSGNFGIGHDVATMLGAAEALGSRHDVRFVFVGGGKRKAEVEEFVRLRGLENAVLAPYQPRERLDASLSCADVHLVSLLEGLEGCIVPCKLFGAMAAERPTIFIGSPESEIARVLVERNCGIVVRQGSVEELVRAILELRERPEFARDMGLRARQALAEAYDRTTACEAWRAALEEVVAPEARLAHAGVGAEPGSRT